MDKTTTETKVFEPLFKVGDKVKVVAPKDPKNYRYGYSPTMQSLEGQTAVITRCFKSSDCKSYSDDGYVYGINIGSLSSTWSSQSFEKVEQDEDGPQPLFKVGDKVKIVLPKNRLKSRVGCTDTMQKMEGTVAIITYREKCKYPNGYDDDGYIYNVDTNRYCWSSQFFVKVESSVTEDSKPQPLFKIGDIVKILPYKSLTTYRNGYNDSMRALEGKTATITSCKLSSFIGPYNDDGYSYTINLDGGSYNWSSQSFIKVESLPLFKVGDMVKIIPPKNPQKYRCGYIDKMRALEGKVAVITKCTYSSSCLYPDDNYMYKIDIDDLDLTWSSQSFMKVEYLQQCVVPSAQADITSIRVDDTISWTAGARKCHSVSILDCISHDKPAKKEEKKERYKLNFKIK